MVRIVILMVTMVTALDNSCWFRVKPATKQRSEGEKVAIHTSTHIDYRVWIIYCVV